MGQWLDCDYLAFGLRLDNQRQVPLSIFDAVVVDACFESICKVSLILQAELSNLFGEEGVGKTSLLLRS